MLKFYNSMTRKEEVFNPIEEGKVKIYSCGPTVYNYAHIGNLRAAIFWDTLKRTLSYFKYELIDVVNITDVGHLVSDEDDGEDKMLKAAKREKKDPYEIAKFYENAYIQNLKSLNIRIPKHMPRATEHITEQIDIIKKLDKNGYTYKTSDGVYFDVSKFKNYGKLSRQSLEQKKAGARVEVKSEKRNPQDFALWKFLTGDNINHIMKWESPWGLGFPGWHIECSAMGHKYLGSKIDIHTGGIDHLPVHHENEIAQNECSGVIKKVNFWMHNAFVLINNEKMSKSLGNFYTLFDLIEKGYNPIAFRELCLRAHYRKQMNFTLESLKAGETNIKKINEFYSYLQNLNPSNKKYTIKRINTGKYRQSFKKALCDDLNTPLALAAVYEFMNDVNREIELNKEEIKQALKFMDETNEVLALLETTTSIPKEIIELAKQRQKARDSKDFAKSDELRDKIKDKGYIVRDSKLSKEGFIIDKL